MSISPSLKITLRIVFERAKQKKQSGEVPTFLGVDGMLALMYDCIVRYNNNKEDTDWILDLVVNGVFALQQVLPDIEEDIPDPVLAEDSATPVNEDEDGDSERWTPVKPGQDLSSATPQGSEE